MSVMLRRSLVLVTLMFWQGGFTFYAGVVVPIGTQVLGGAQEQARVTRRVTPYLNLAGAVTLVVLAWDIVASRDPIVRRRWLRWLTWGVQAVALAVLAWLYVRLEMLLHPESPQPTDRLSFRLLHRSYLWVSAVQWGFVLVFLVLTLRAWKAEDGRDAVGSSVLEQAR